MARNVSANVPQLEQNTPCSTPNPVWFPAKKSFFRTIEKTTFLLLVCAYFAYCYACRPPFFDLSRYTLGLEKLPYQFRVLPMFLFRAFMHSDAFVHAARKLEPFHYDPYLVIMGFLGFSCLMVAIIATAATLTQLTGDSVFSFWASMLVALMAQFNLASAWGATLTTPYDMPSLMFFSLGLYLIVSRRWWLYYLVFPFAVLNREGACMITVTFVLWEWVHRTGSGSSLRARLKAILPHAALQLAIWTAIKVSLSLYFAHNEQELHAYGGGLFITHFFFNLHELLKPQQWPILASICGFTLPVLWLQRRWIGCAPLSAVIAVVLPLSFVAFLIMGVIVEIRIFSDWIALVCPAIALIVHNRFRPVPANPAT